MDLQELQNLLRQGSRGRQLTALLTGRTDARLREIFDSVNAPSGLCLIAVGGYGRAELAPGSDVDIMLLARDRSVAGHASDFLYRLWDTNLQIGHSFRTPSECLEEAKKDIKTRTSLLEHRLIAGDPDLYRTFLENVYPEIAFRDSRRFVSEKLREVEKRHREVSDSVFLLEPHLKEGRGALRDIHTLLWLASIRTRVRRFSELERVLGAGDFRSLCRAYDFLLTVRFCLHLLSGRRNDVLSFEFHSRIAEILGFLPSRRFLGAERFMRYLYLKTSAVNDISGRAFESFSVSHSSSGDERGSRFIHFLYAKKPVTENFSLSRNRIVANSDDFRNRPERMIEAFAAMAKTGKRFSPRLGQAMRDNLSRVNRTVRSSQKAASHFRGIIQSGRIALTLRAMHDSGVLGRFIPEFGGLSFLVVYEPYHRYTVDEHTLRAIQRLEELEGTKYRSLGHLSGIYRRFADREALFLSLLFHDIGKGRIELDYRYGTRGGHHEEVGYLEVKSIIERFNLPVALRNRVEFLVQRHLLMSGVSLKDEAEDPEVIARFADEVGDQENLDALYLLTYADMAAVNQGFWTEWKARLLRDLYEATAGYLGGYGHEPGKGIDEFLSRAALPEKEREGVRSFLSFMPRRYAIATTPERVVEDYRLHATAAREGLAFAVREDPGGTAEITVGTGDRPGLFAAVIGVMSSLGMNIFRARAYTGSGGIVIDRIQIANWSEIEWDGLIPVLGEQLSQAICAIVPAEAYEVRIRRLRETTAAVAATPIRFEPFVELDNETAADHSILEFFAKDRFGLLYDTVSLLHRMDIDIISARINTESGIANDTFSLQLNGAKVAGAAVQELLLSLWERLG